MVWRSLPDWKPARVTYEVRGSRDTLYIKGIAYGLTGDNQQWWITSNRGNKEPDSLMDYVFTGLEPFSYRLTADTLVVFSRRTADAPVQFRSGITVRQVELSNPQMMSLFRTGDSLGLGRTRFGEDQPGRDR